VKDISLVASAGRFRVFMQATVLAPRAASTTFRRRARTAKAARCAGDVTASRWCGASVDFQLFLEFSSDARSLRYLAAIGRGGAAMGLVAAPACRRIIARLHRDAFAVLDSPGIVTSALGRWHCRRPAGVRRSTLEIGSSNDRIETPRG